VSTPNQAAMEWLANTRGLIQILQHEKKKAAKERRPELEQLIRRLNNAQSDNLKVRSGAILSLLPALESMQESSRAGIVAYINRMMEVREVIETLPAGEFREALTEFEEQVRMVQGRKSEAAPAV